MIKKKELCHVFVFFCEEDKRDTGGCGILISLMHNGGRQVQPQTHPRVKWLHVCGGLGWRVGLTC